VKNIITQSKLNKKIKDLREEAGLSQEQLAEKIDLSRVAVSQLETGNRGLDVLELDKIAKVFGVSIDSLLKNEQPSQAKKTGSKKIIKVKFNKDKLGNVILYILEKCGGKPNLGETVLYKLLYFIDFDSYELYGSPITGMNYVRLRYGPVPQATQYNPVVEKMIRNSQLRIITQNYHGMVQKRYIALVEPDMSVFYSQEKELKIVDEIIAKLSDMSAISIENYVHGDIPWRKTLERETINYDLVFNRVPPYSRRDYESEFIQTGASDVHDSLRPLSKEEFDYYIRL